MAGVVASPDLPVIQPLGDSGMVVRFATSLSESANSAAVEFALRLQQDLPHGVWEVCPNLVSVLLRYDPARVSYRDLAGEVRLRLAGGVAESPQPVRLHNIEVMFDGPDLAVAAETLGMGAAEFIEAHCASRLRVLATGFAPGFVYCGFHEDRMDLPRRPEVRRSVAAGTVLFAARQTAITATTVPTGWQVIGHTSFRNFDPAAEPPTRLRAGDGIVFEAIP